MTNREEALGRLRAAFEAWIGASPYERNLAQWNNSPERAWPSQYKDIAVQLAWEAWKESALSAPTEKPLDVAGLIERLREMAGYKYQYHTVHAPMVMQEAAAALQRQAEELAAAQEDVKRYRWLNNDIR